MCATPRTAALALLMSGLAAPAHPLAAALATALDAEQYRYELMLEREFPVTGAGSLVVDVADGDVEIAAGGPDRVSVRIYVGARDPEWARSVFERMRFTTRADGNRIRITARDAGIRRDEWRQHRGVGVRVVLEIPARFAVDVLTRDGDVTIGRHEGSVTIRTRDGDIRVGDLRGGTIALETSDGDVRAGTLHADRISVRTGDGDIDLRQVSGALDAETGDGDIRVTLAAPGETRLRSGDGDITIYAERTLRAEIDFAGEEVDLGSPFRVAGRFSRGGVRGALNGGGPRIEARTHDGAVTLRRR